MYKPFVQCCCYYGLRSLSSDNCLIFRTSINAATSSTCATFTETESKASPTSSVQAFPNDSSMLSALLTTTCLPRLWWKEYEDIDRRNVRLRRRSCSYWWPNASRCINGRLHSRFRVIIWKWHLVIITEFNLNGVLISTFRHRCKDL